MIGISRCGRSGMRHSSLPTKSWYSGANLPGQKVELLEWVGGMVPYVDVLYRTLGNEYWRRNVNKAQGVDDDGSGLVLHRDLDGSHEKGF